jgi:hypothetical protein
MSATMSKREREDWLVARVLAEPGGADVCNRDFVQDYIDATGMAHRVTWFGANKCPALGRDLARLVKKRRLSRHRTGIEGMAGMGFPRWVWMYQKPKLTGWEPQFFERPEPTQ